MKTVSNAITEVNRISGWELERLCEDLYTLSLLWHDAVVSVDWHRRCTFIGEEMAAKAERLHKLYESAYPGSDILPKKTEVANDGST